MSQPGLSAVIFCQKDALRPGGEPLREALRLPERLSSSRALLDGEIQTQFVSAHLRAADVPLAFHRESSGAPPAALERHADMAEKLESYGRVLQYLFSDGLILYGNQILFHRYSKFVPRHLLPLSVNVNSELRARVRHGRLTSWQIEAEQAVISVLMAAARASRLAKTHPEMDPLALYFCHDDQANREREAARIETVELGSEEWGPWRLNTALPEPVSHVHYGRARIELDPDELGDLHGLSQTFFVDPSKGRLLFHGFADQLQRLRARLGPGQAAADRGLTIHLSGHANIQASLQEISELGVERGRQGRLPVFPRSIEVAKEKIKPRLSITGDGSFRFSVLIDAEGGPLEAHGLPQGSSYLLFNLQNGLGATTGFANAQLAHARKGLKRERDLKILKSIGYSTLIFHDAACFALGLPLSDGTLAKTERELCDSLFTRLGSLILKSEGWPIQSGSLTELCSKNVTTLIEGFVRQVVMDFEGRDTSLYLPHGELRLKGLSRHVALLFHAMVADLAVATQGQCFTKARTKYFEEFLHGRVSPEREDMSVRPAVDSETAARMVYQPGINERYVFPESSRPPRGERILSLINQGFQLAIDGKEVEEFDATDFRPEFTIREAPQEAVPTGGHKINWFELNPKFFFRGTEITGDQAQRLSRDGLLEFDGKLYRVKAQDMPSLQRLTKFWASIQSHAAGILRSKRRKTEDTYFQLPRSQTLELLALRASGVKMRGGPKWDEICRFYDSLNDERETIRLPESFKAQLQPYQMSGVRWINDLHELGLGGILADDMGLGKTVTSLAFMELLRAKDRLGACLVLVPTSLTYNWLAEAQRFAPELPVRIFSSREAEETLDFIKANPNCAIICTYGLLQENIEFFQQVLWSCLILDEAQNLKNITTKRTTAARKLDAGFKLCLTGTPIENHYGELYSLFDLIVPGSLGDLPTFRENYVNPVRVLRENIDYLRLKVKPLLLRRTKAQVMHELPPKIEQTVKLPFEDDQRRIYRDIATSYNDQIRNAIARQGEAKSQLQMLTALLRLRQVCSDPASIPGVQYHGEPPKVTTLLEAIRELTEGGASALIFTQFLATFERIRAALSAAKIKHFDISGADSRANRDRKIRAFQDESDGAVMLMTLKTGGVGLNLVKASYIFHIEPWWNPAVENQATDRAHRIGQTKAVQAYRYIIKDSVEEKIEILKDIKTRRFDAMFAVSESETELGAGSGALSQQDFEFLLGN